MKCISIEGAVYKVTADTLKRLISSPLEDLPELLQDIEENNTSKMHIECAFYYS